MCRRGAPAGAGEFLSSHILSEVEALSDRVAILRAGEVVEVGTLAEMRHLSALSIDATSPVARRRGRRTVELLLAGRTTRRQATGQAMTGLAAGWAVLWALTAGCTLAAGSRSSVGFPVSASLFYATAATGSASVFLAVGALASQLAPACRRANGLAAAVFAVAFLIRMVADSVAVWPGCAGRARSAGSRSSVR